MKVVGSQWEKNFEGDSYKGKKDIEPYESFLLEDGDWYAREAKCCAIECARLVQCPWWDKEVHMRNSGDETHFCK